MSTKFTDLYCKEVICVCNGQRLGYVTDARIDLPEGHILAIIVPGPCRLFGLWSRREEYVIPWHCIRRIGPDIILVDVKPEECRVPCQKFRLPL